MDRSRVDTVARRDALPAWARWNDKLDRRYTLGAEEEVMLLDPCHWSLAESSDRRLVDCVRRLAFANGAERQRTVAARGGRLERLVADLADQFSPSETNSLAGGSPPARTHRRTTERGG